MMVPFTPILIAKLGAEIPPSFSVPLQKALAKVEFPGKKFQKNPSGLTPTTLPPVKGDLPAPKDRGSKQIKVIHAVGFRQKDQKVIANGKYEIEYQGYRISGQSMEGDTGTEVFDFYGDVKVVGEKADIAGDHVRVYFKDKRYEIFDGEVVFPARKTSKLLLQDLYVKGESSQGTQQQFYFEGSDFTTCSYHNSPHFHLEATSADVRPSKRIVLRHVNLVALGKKILSFPYLVLPLDEPSTRYTPEVGQNPFEGYFVKSRYAYPLAAGSVLYHLDYFSKLGNGFGADVKKELSNGTKQSARFYTIPTGPKELLFQNQNSFNWGRSVVDLSTDFSRNNHLIQSGVTNLSGRLGFNIPSRTGASRLNFSQSENKSSGFKFVQQTGTLDDTRRLSSSTNTNLNLTWTKAKTTTASDASGRQQLDVRFGLSQDLKSASAQLDYQRSIPIGQSGSFFSVADRTPVLTLSTDSRRLRGNKRGGANFRSALSFGEYADGATQSYVRRTNFNIETDGSTKGNQRVVLNWGGRFSQGIYSDGTAQFVGGLNAALSYRFGQASNFNIRYSYLRPQGYTPLSFDRLGRSDVVTSDISVKAGRPWSFGAQTGYDFLQADSGNLAWQQLGIRGEYISGPDTSVRGLSTYDPFIKGWSNHRLDIGLKRNGSFLSIGSRYDVPRHTWGNVNLFAGGLRLGRLSGDVRLEYNGYLNRFENRQFAAIYDLHCWEAIFQFQDSPVGFRPGRTLQFFVRLKAFPFDTLFGAGRNGNAIGTGTGLDF